MFGVPRIIYAGDSYSWIDTLPDYNPEEWILSHLFRGVENKLDVFSTVDVDVWRSQITADESSKFTPGKFWVQIQVTKPDHRITLDTIEIEVKPNFANLSSYDGRSDDEKELDAVSQAIVECDSFLTN